MTTRKFNEKVGFSGEVKPLKIGSYFIGLGARDLDFIRQQTRPFQFRRDLQHWVAQRTGVLPDVEVLKDTVSTPSPKLAIHCSAVMVIEKIRDYFADEIANVKHIPRRSELAPDTCWKPDGP
jgi:hypothetical protein